MPRSKRFFCNDDKPHPEQDCARREVTERIAQLVEGHKLPFDEIEQARLIDFVLERNSDRFPSEKVIEQRMTALARAMTGTPNRRAHSIIRDASLHPVNHVPVPRPTEGKYRQYLDDTSGQDTVERRGGIKSDF